MSNRNKQLEAKDHLDRYTSLLSEMVEYLVPNSLSSDVEYIENNIDKILLTYKALNMLSENIWFQWENIIMSELKDHIKKGFFFRFEHSVLFAYNRFIKYYNNETIAEAKRKKILYKSTQLKGIIYGVQNIFENGQYEFEKFKKLYKLNKQEIKNNSSSKLNFGYKELTTDKLSNIYKQLTDYLDGFISGGKSAESNFINVFMAEDLNLLRDNIYIECDNPQFHYIIKNLQPLFKHKIFSIIGKSKKFYSKRGTLISANSLSKAGSSQPNPKGKEIIDRVFQKIK